MEGKGEVLKSDSCFLHSWISQQNKNGLNITWDAVNKWGFNVSQCLSLTRSLICVCECVLTIDFRLKKVLFLLMILMLPAVLQKKMLEYQKWIHGQSQKREKFLQPKKILKRIVCKMIAINFPLHLNLYTECDARDGNYYILIDKFIRWNGMESETDWTQLKY